MTTAKKISENPSVTATRLLLKKRRKALSIDIINNALKKASLKPVTAEILDKNFKHVCKDGAQKWLLGGAAACTKQKPDTKPVCNKKPCGKKTVNSKKVCPTKAQCCNNHGGEVAGFCKISVSKNFDTAEYNQRAQMHNALVNMPLALEQPEDFIFMAGVGSWPKSYRGVEVISHQSFSGVLLCPRKFIQKVEV